MNEADLFHSQVISDESSVSECEGKNLFEVFLFFMEDRPVARDLK